MDRIARLPDAEAVASPLILSVPAALRRAGREMALVVGAEPGAPPAPDRALLRLVLKARSLWDTLLGGDVAGLGELAAREGMSGSYATRLVRAAFLAPDLLAAILVGEQPDDLTAARLLRACRRGLPARLAGAARPPRPLLLSTPASDPAAPFGLLHMHCSPSLRDSALAFLAIRSIARSNCFSALQVSDSCSIPSLMLRPAGPP